MVEVQVLLHCCCQWPLGSALAVGGGAESCTVRHSAARLAAQAHGATTERSSLYKPLQATAARQHPRPIPADSWPRHLRSCIRPCDSARSSETSRQQPDGDWRRGGRRGGAEPTGGRPGAIWTESHLRQIEPAGSAAHKDRRGCCSIAQAAGGEQLQQALLALAAANPNSSLGDDWKGPLSSWRGLKLRDGDGELTEL